MEEVIVINRDRIVDVHLVGNEYFCSICHNLVWKPRLCASCEQMFCEKCIEMWLKNMHNNNICPSE